MLSHRGLVRNVCRCSSGRNLKNLIIESLTFPLQLIGTTSAAKSVTLTNTDSVNPLAIDGILDSADYSETDTCGTSLAPLASCTIFVTFSPNAAGAISGAITIQDEASNYQQHYQ